MRQELPLEFEEFILQIFLKFYYVEFLGFAFLCLLECQKKVFIGAEFLKKMSASLHGIAAPRETKSHFKTVGRLPVGVDVAPVVVVVVVVPADKQAKP